ncbi:unnamed protein product, partial [Choristocarpus tenellus]
HPCLNDSTSLVDTVFGENTAGCQDFFYHVWKSSTALVTAETGSYIISGCDLMCCLMLIWLYKELRADVVRLRGVANSENITPADFTVCVKGLPEDAQDEEVIDHFSSLFRLDQPGWEFKGWGCYSSCRIGSKRVDLPQHVVDYMGASIGASLKAVKSTAHSR